MGFKLDPEKQKTCDAHWAKIDLKARKAAVNQVKPPAKRQRLDKDKQENEDISNEDQELKELECTDEESTNTNSNTNTNTDSNSNSNSNANSNNSRSTNSKSTSRVQQFRFNEENRQELFKKCINKDIMSIDARLRNAKFSEIWSELIEADTKWNLASLTRVRNEFYNEQRTV